MKLSQQAMSCIMVSLQKSLMEQSDIVPMLKNFELEARGEEVIVTNPPQQILFKDEE